MFDVNNSFKFGNNFALKSIIPSKQNNNSLLLLQNF